MSLNVDCGQPDHTSYAVTARQAQHHHLNMAAAPITIKVLLIGSSSVGKSSVLLRFTDDTFLTADEISSTIG